MDETLLSFDYPIPPRVGSNVKLVEEIAFGPNADIPVPSYVKFNPCGIVVGLMKDEDEDRTLVKAEFGNKGYIAAFPINYLKVI